MDQQRKNTLTVGQINDYLKGLVQTDPFLSRIRVVGEVSNLTYHKTGHIYFTLKDATGTINCAMWKSRRAAGLTYPMKEGDRVLVTGSVDIYAPRGTYSLIALRIEADGAGTLFAQFEQLKKKLLAEGLFDPSHKKKIPPYAMTIGVVTAPTGAAVRDIIRNVRRRNPYAKIYLFPALVQGDGAAESIVTGIRTLDQIRCDVMIVGRGGGSIEDLWAFNEENVARAIYAAKTPIISAVGHETDTTIADFAADLRVSTPTAAAEAATFDFLQFEKDLRNYDFTMQQMLLQRVQKLRARLLAAEKRLASKSPERHLSDLHHRISDMEDRMLRLLVSKTEDAGAMLKEDARRMQDAMERLLQSRRQQVALYAGRLDGLSPVKKLQSGFSFVRTADGKTLRDVRQVSAGDPLRIDLAYGALDVRTEKLYEPKSSDGAGGH